MKKTLLTSAIALFFTMGMLALTSCGGGEKDCEKKCDKTEECKSKCEKDGKACTGKKECKKGEGKEKCGADCKKECCSAKEGAHKCEKEGCENGCTEECKASHGHVEHGHGEGDHDGHEGHDHPVDSAA